MSQKHEHLRKEWTASPAAKHSANNERVKSAIRNQNWHNIRVLRSRKVQNASERRVQKIKHDLETLFSEGIQLLDSNNYPRRQFYEEE